MNVDLPCSQGWCRVAPPFLSSQQKYWLFRPGALTGGLRQLGSVHLRVRAEHVHGIPIDEASALSLKRGTPVWVREVIMSVNDIDCIVARSLTPLAASHGVWQAIRRLGNRPLADILYNDRQVRRSAFVCRRLSAEVPLYRSARTYCDSGSVLWARRSVFWRHGQPLLVAECFLPSFWRINQAPATPIL